jgi:hypothetical protein
VSYNAILLGDGQVDQLIEAICPDSVESFLQLGVETPAEAVSLLLIRISMVTCILAQVCWVYASSPKVFKGEAVFG